MAEPDPGHSGTPAWPVGVRWDWILICILHAKNAYDTWALAGTRSSQRHGEHKAPEISLKYSGFKNGSLLHTRILDCLVCILHAKNALSALGRGLLVRWLLDLYFACKKTHMTHGCLLGPDRVKVVLSLQSCAFRSDLRKLGWLSARLANDFVKIQNIEFLLWSNGILMILRLRKLQ